VPLLVSGRVLLWWRDQKGHKQQLPLPAVLAVVESFECTGCYGVSDIVIDHVLRCIGWTCAVYARVIREVKSEEVLLCRLLQVCLNYLYSVHRAGITTNSDTDL